MTLMSRRTLLTRAPLAAAGALVLADGGCRSPQQLSPVVETAFGKLRGVRNEGVNIYKGVPYAGSVAGPHRFREPAPLVPWGGVRDALQLGPPSIQAPNQTFGINEPDPAEDCLYLNIWTPANDHRKRPVMFYNHGGGFGAGSGGSVVQDGANLARYFDVVVVQTNHRLGMLGYLYLDELGGDEYRGSGNRGLLDIVQGLRWVHDNIAQFGGDPNNVMVFGESGGGAKTSCLYAMPAAAPYFSKASIESGPGIRMTEPETASRTTRMVLDELGIAPDDWRRLLEVPAADLLAAQLRLSELAATSRPHRSLGIGATTPGGFGPVVDGHVLLHHPFDPQAPAESRDKPLMVGWNEDEYTFFGMVSGDTDAFKLDDDGLFQRLEPGFGKDTRRVIETFASTRQGASPSDIFVAVMSWSFAGMGSVYIAEKKTEQQGAPCYLYNFGYKSDVMIPDTAYEMGTPHAMDIPFKFNNVVPGSDTSWIMGGSREERFEASRVMAELWTTFARTGTPAANDQPAWPAYTLTERPTMRIDAPCKVVHDRFHAERQLWESLGYTEA